MWGTLHKKLFLIFSLFTLSVIIVLVPLNSSYFKKREQVNLYVNHINDLYIHFLQDFKNHSDFFSYETINPVYYETSKSIYIDQHINSNKYFYYALGFLSSSSEFKSRDISALINRLKNEIVVYDITFDEMTDLVRQRGFASWGMIGDVHRFAQKLDSVNEIDRYLLLSVFQSERDYLLYGLDVNIKQFDERLNRLRNQILKSTRLSNTRRQTVRGVLDNYSSSFYKMVNVSNNIGIKNNIGLKNRIDSQAFDIQTDIKRLIFVTEQRKEVYFQRLKRTYLMIMIFILTLSFILSYFISKTITQPIMALSGYITNFIASGFSSKDIILVKSVNDEVGKLTSNYLILRNEIVNLLNYFKQKVEERTIEIRHQKDKIVNQKEEIQSQNEELAKVNQLYERQNKLLKLRNTEIVDSILYAKRIQDALLPNKDFIEKALPNSFVLFKPCAIVSGDFYWVHEQTGDCTNRVLFSVLDCTGHGVPGAFMSLLGNSGLNLGVRSNRKIDLPYLIRILNNVVYDSLHKNLRSENHLHDCIELGLCYLDKTTLEIEFFGAFRSLLVIRNGVCIDYPGQKISVGNLPEINHIEIQKIQLHRGDMLYLFTDGYYDQFGGNDGRKFKRRPFYDLLSTIAHLTVDEQRRVLFNNFDEWRGDYTQIDDVLIMGVRV